MILKPQDVLILLKLVAMKAENWSYAFLGRSLFMSSSEVHAGVKRAVAARLMDAHRAQPVQKALEEFIIHGIKYAFPPDRGGLTRGIPTAFAAPPLDEFITQSNEPPPVWPYAEGTIRGYEFSPLYRSAPRAALEDEELYQLLALIDAIRDGRARERHIAIKEFKARLHIP